MGFTVAVRQFDAPLDAETKEGRATGQDAINRYYPILPKFFGKLKSKNNEIFWKWGIKQRTNEDMLVAYVNRAQTLVEELGLTLPDLSESAA